MRRHKASIRLAVAILSIGLAAIPLSAGEASDSLSANRNAAQIVPQTGDEAARLTRQLATIRLPAGFKISLFALVPGARDLAISPDGHTIFVGTLGSEVYLVKAPSLAGPAQSVKTFAPSIEKVLPHGVCFGPDRTLYLAEQNRILAFPEAAAEAESPNLTARVVVARGQLIPPEFESEGHSARVCRVGPDGLLYVTIGQPTNLPTREEWEEFSKAGLGAIIRLRPDGTQRAVFATGLRNSVGLDFNPKDKSLWFTDNQVDLMGDDRPPGELNRATRAGQHFGFPWYGGGHVRTKEWENSTPPADVVFPQVEMIAHAADLGMTFYRGSTFPARYRGGIFSAQHGSWNRTIPVGARIMFTTLKPDGTAQGAEPFAEGWLKPNHSYQGRPVDVAEMPDGALLVSDDYAGAIYRIVYAP